MDPLLSTHELSIGFGREALLSRLSLQAEAGDLVGIIGVNGIGKSTLLRTLAGLLAPMSGAIRIGGRDLEVLSPTERARAVSIVLTGRPVAGALDVRTLVSLGRQPWTDQWGRLSPTDETCVDEALEKADAVHLQRKVLNTCSDGEAQKVLIARAIAQATPVMLLDEPTAYLDLPNRASIVRMLKRIAGSEGKAVLFTTHDLQLALDLCDTIWLLRRDGTLWQGPPSEALRAGELQRAFASTGIRFDAVAGTHRFTV